MGMLKDILKMLKMSKKEKKFSKPLLLDYDKDLIYGSGIKDFLDIPFIVNSEIIDSPYPGDTYHDLHPELWPDNIKLFVSIEEEKLKIYLKDRDGRDKWRNFQLKGEF